MPLAANLCIALLCWFRWYREYFANERRRHGWLLTFYVFMALATLAKGPVAPALAALIIASFVLLRREPRFILRTLWWPGVLAFLALTAPWYWLVELRTGTFFRVFFLEHNLARFATDVYRHRQPFWYYVPVLLASLGPWMIYGVAVFVTAARKWKELSQARDDSAAALTQFLLVWGIAPIIFFSFSQSKLPGYILPAIPAWTLLLGQWLNERYITDEPVRLSWLIPHATVVSTLLLAAALLPYQLLALPVPRAGRLLAGVCAVAALVGIVWTVKANGLRLLRFATLVPVVIATALILRFDAPALDARLSTRPLAAQIAAMETKPLPVTVSGVPRQIEYGLNFYLDHTIANYDRGETPPAEHIIVTRAGSENDLRAHLADRRVVKLGDFPTQKLEIYWVGSVGSAAQMHQH